MIQANTSYQEMEVKFAVESVSFWAAKLEHLNAHLTQPRILERNYRFDTPEGKLRRAGQVLRLRQDSAARLTYKGRGGIKDEVQTRPEIEFVVEDFDLAQAFLEALGYRLWVIYEKYRTTYALDTTLVTLDELPYGNFIEVEGPSADAIGGVAQQLGLVWDRRINDSYLALFDRVHQGLKLPFRDLTFSNFQNREVRPSDLGVERAG